MQELLSESLEIQLAISITDKATYRDIVHNLPTNK